MASQEAAHCRLGSSGSRYSGAHASPPPHHAYYHYRHYGYNYRHHAGYNHRHDANHSGPNTVTAALSSTPSGY